MFVKSLLVFLMMQIVANYFSTCLLNGFNVNGQLS
jgi:hypothetical protein